MSGIGPISETPALTDVYIGPFNPADFTQTAAVTAANYVFLSPFEVHKSVVVTGAKSYISVQSGNIDVGVYNAAGTRLGSTGSTACPAAGERALTFTGSVSLVPGTRYYLAFAADNTTAAGAIRTGIINTSGYIATSFPLPTTLAVPGTATLENWMWVLT